MRLKIEIEVDERKLPPQWRDSFTYAHEVVFPAFDKLSEVERVEVCETRTHLVQARSFESGARLR